MDEIKTQVKPSIVFVETHITNMNSVISEIAMNIGVPLATARVQKWFQEYSAFTYDSYNGNLLFYKTRYAGYWEMDKNVIDYKK